MKILTKIKYGLTLFWHSLFRGMADADSIITAPPKNDNDNTSIVQHIGVGGVFDDMLQQKETKQVVEIRDKYYRVFKEADKWDTSNIAIIGEDENGVIFGNIDGIRKKTKLDFMKHPPVYNPENLQLRTIQDNKHIQKKNLFDNDLSCLNDFETTLTITRDGITSIVYDVAIISDFKGEVPTLPEKGDFVRLVEQNKRFMITGKIDINSLNTSSISNYSDMFADNTGGGGGNAGI